MNFIRTFKNHFSSKWCKETIDYFENNKQLHHNGYMGGDNRIENTEISIDLRDNKWLHLGEELTKGVTEYKQDYPLIDTNMSPWSLFTSCQLMKYNPGESYKYEHCEHGSTSDGYGLSRVIAWQINLNDIAQEGGTFFNHYNHTIKPTEGSLSFWPAGWTHMHKGLKAKVNKYIITGWYNFK